MADPAPGADAPTERRHRRNDRKRRRVRRVAGGLGALVIVAALVVFATGIVHFGDDEQPSVANTVAAGHDAAATTTTVATKQCRALSAADPLRLWVGGDSLAGSLGPSLGAIAGATGVVQPYFDSRVSSGLASPGFFDWPDHATTEMARLNPEIVVFIIGANDWTAVSGDSWKADYTDKVDAMMKTLIGPGRTVYWVGSPTLKDPKMDAAVVDVNAVAQDVAKQHGHVHYVDAYKLFSGADGTFSAELPDETGKVVTMRAGDGVHLTSDGADYLARSVYQLVDAQCDVNAQKVAGVTKPAIETEGSTQVAPGSGSSSSGSSRGTIATTPPATAPPVTEAPTTAPPVTEAPTTAPAPATTTPVATTIPTTTPTS